MAHSSKSFPPAASPAAYQYEDTARIVEHAAFLDEDDHPQVLADAIGMLIREIHFLKPDLLHSSQWDERHAAPETRLLQEARWRGATARRVAVKGAEEALSILAQEEALRRRGKVEAHG